MSAAKTKVTRRVLERDTMTSEERIRACISLQRPDRVPVVPLFYYFNALYNRMSYADLMDPTKYIDGLMRVFDDLGPWDANYFVNFYDRELIAFGIPMRVLEPGIDLPADVPRQFLEEEVMKLEEYDWLINLGHQRPDSLGNLTYFRWFIERLLPSIWSHLPGGWRAYPIILPRLIRFLNILKGEFARWAEKGVTAFYPIPLEAAFDNFSLARGLIPFSKDLNRIPEKISAAAEALTDSYVFMFRFVCTVLGVKRAEIFVHRSSNDFISPAQFKKLSLPSLKMLIEKLADAGISSILHCDGCWDLNLELMRELPAGRVVMQCDGTSDIRLAKEVVGDRICIYGDVPASMLAQGTPAEVDEYCHSLIEDVGKGGGFILGSGCEVAPNAKPENVKAMCESVARYGYYDR